MPMMTSRSDRRGVRVYHIDGVEYPSVTTLLSAINKPALGPWYAKQERAAFETALLELAASMPLIPADHLLDRVIALVGEAKAGDRAKMSAATIGTAAHALIEWHTRRLLGEKIGAEPIVPDAAAWAVEAWKDWAKDVAFHPLVVERVVHCPRCGYAGSVDWIARVRGVVTLGDIKTGKAVYPEAFLQNVAYRHAAAKNGHPTDAGLILRLPKTTDDPNFEAVPVPTSVTLRTFHAVNSLWRWLQSINSQPSFGHPTFCRA